VLLLSSDYIRCAIIGALRLGELGLLTRESDHLARQAQGHNRVYSRRVTNARSAISENPFDHLGLIGQQRLFV